MHMDWDRAPAGRQRVPTRISRTDKTVILEAVVTSLDASAPLSGFIEAGGAVSMDAAHYVRAVGTAPVEWTRRFFLNSG